MEHYLVRFSQSHETFRLPELQALATLEGLDLEVVTYNPEVCLCCLPFLYCRAAYPFI